MPNIKALLGFGLALVIAGVLIVLDIAPPVSASGITFPAYNLIQNNGSSLAQRQTLNMSFSAGAGSCADSGGKTVCTITGTATGAGTVTNVSFTGGLISVATPTTTPAFTVAGTSGGVPYFASSSTWASSAAGAGGHLMLWGGAGSAPTDGGVPPVSPTTNQNIRTIGASFGSFQSGATALSAASTACVPTYYSGTIQAVEIIGNVSGSATIDVQTVAHSSWTGTASVSSITAADIPALSSAARFTDTTLTGWTTSFTAGTDVCFVMTSPTTVAGLSITLKVAAN